MGGKGTRTDLSGGGAFNRVQLIADKLGLGLSKLKQLQSIYRYEPDLIQHIDEGELSVNAAYQVVRDKHLKPSKPRQKDFSKEFRSLLKATNPTPKEVQQVLNSTYPYSLVDPKSGEIDPSLEQLRERMLDNLEMKKSQKTTKIENTIQKMSSIHLWQQWKKKLNQK